VILSLNMTKLPPLLYSGVAVGDGGELRAVLGTKGIEKLDKILRDLYTHRYKVSFRVPSKSITRTTFALTRVL
jgi:hypothetical protein